MTTLEALSILGLVVALLLTLVYNTMRMRWLLQLEARRSKEREKAEAQLLVDLENRMAINSELFMTSDVLLLDPIQVRRSPSHE